MPFRTYKGLRGATPMPFRTYKGLCVRTGYTCILLTEFFVAPTPSIARAYMGLGVKTIVWCTMHLVNMNLILGVVT